MKLFFRLMILMISMFAVSACKIAHQTSSARAAYGNAAPDYKPNKSQKKKKKVRPEIKRKKKKADNSVFHGRPY